MNHNNNISCRASGTTLTAGKCSEWMIPHMYMYVCIPLSVYISAFPVLSVAAAAAAAVACEHKRTQR